MDEKLNIFFSKTDTFYNKFKAKTSISSGINE